MMLTLIKNATVINEGTTKVCDVLIENEKILKIVDTGNIDTKADIIIDAEGLLLLPGIIDDQVHFREPGMTHKGDIYSESRAAAAGGVTSFMEMPNTSPSTISIELLNQKNEIASKNSLVNYSFFLGATNDNIDEIKNIDPTEIAGVKMFLGSSTGNLLVDNIQSIENILANSPVIVAAHCEDDAIINKNLAEYKNKYGDNIPVKSHPSIRSEDACYTSSSNAVRIAKKTGGKLHVFHLSTEKEISLFSDKPLSEKNITAEVCVHHLWFNDTDYDKYGTKIKWNPAIKKETDRLALIKALKDGKIDIVATDHAPHTIEEKDNVYTKAPSGAPMVQHSLLVMLELAKQNYFSVSDVVKWMCHNPADLFKINLRGYIRENYFADLVLVDPNTETLVTKENILYKCGWSPLEGTKFKNKIHTTFVNGKIVYVNGKIIDNHTAGEKLKFNR
ncbi:MAG: dihydroorotase [Bacteroidales bacterium]|nr:dihydroorotase [Bacteroidales bacterium]